MKRKRGLGSADLATRRRVARLGGMASHGGGRRKRVDYFEQVPVSPPTGRTEPKA